MSRGSGPVLALSQYCHKWLGFDVTNFVTKAGFYWHRGPPHILPKTAQKLNFFAKNVKGGPVKKVWRGVEFSENIKSWRPNPLLWLGHILLENPARETPIWWEAPPLHILFSYFCEGAFLGFWVEKRTNFPHKWGGQMQNFLVAKLPPTNRQQFKVD